MRCAFGGDFHFHPVDLVEWIQSSIHFHWVHFAPSASTSTHLSNNRIRTYCARVLLQQVYELLFAFVFFHPRMAMKRKRPEEDDSGNKSAVVDSKKSKNDQISDENRITELLKCCLQKVCELQEDLARESEEEEDAEVAGYTACAVETLRFLAAEGLTPDHPVVKGLSQRLLKQ